MSFPHAAVPGQCEKPTVTDVCLESMTVNWEEPKYDGGSSVTGYIIEKKETTSKRWIRVNRDPIRALPLGNYWDVTGLLEGAMYQFRVIAVNAAGCGLPSPPSDPVLCRDPIGKRDTLRCAFSLSPIILTQDSKVKMFIVTPVVQVHSCEILSLGCAITETVNKYIYGI